MSSSLGVHLVYGMFVNELPYNPDFYYHDGDEMDSYDKLITLEDYGFDYVVMYDSEDYGNRLVGHQINSDRDWEAVEINEQMINEGKEIGLLKWQKLYHEMTHEDLKMYISPSYL